MASRSEVLWMLDWAANAFAETKIPHDKTFLSTTYPFSFIYDGHSSSRLLKSWKYASETQEKADRIEKLVTWKDPVTGLKVSATITAYKHYPAVDWILHFENEGSHDTPIIEDIQALDITLHPDNLGAPAVLHQIKGDTEKEDAFLPFDTALAPGDHFCIAPAGGKSSSGAFPFFNFQYGRRGIITAIGWTGQWAASFNHIDSDALQIKAGMERTHLRLHPGERIRSPRILIMAWNNDLYTAHNRFRRLMLFNYLPKPNGRPARIPVALQCFDRYSLRPDWASESGQMKAARVADELGCDTLWLDAAWFPGDFPSGVGNWFAKPDAFPRGLKPVSDLCHDLGLQFMLWFEPERADSNSSIAKEHPEFLYPRTTVEFGGTSHLVNLGDPNTRFFMTDLLSKCIHDYGIDIYRLDFNISPLRFWRENDEPDRQGMSEIRHIEGLYAMWDDLLAHHPGLLIDNVAGGGRRIDLETCMRSIPMWRSDTACGTNPPDWNQTQSYGLSLYIPLHSIAFWSPDAYECRSTATVGVICQLDYLKEGFPMDEAEASIDEAKENQKYWYGDFYPLTPASAAMDKFIAYQFHRPDLNEGMILAFRRCECTADNLVVKAQGLSAECIFQVEIIDDNRNKIEKTLTGRQLMSGLGLHFDRKPGSLLVRYKRIIPRGNLA